MLSRQGGPKPFVVGRLIYTFIIKNRRPSKEKKMILLFIFYFIIKILYNPQIIISQINTNL